jgi:hypothetical protein
MSIDPTIVAAQGQDWLRRGNPGRAGELLSAAAAAESDPDRAIERAGQAAAALIAADRKLGAAQILADVALAKSGGSGAAAAHLQAALMISSGQHVDIDKQVETMLRTNLRQWPSSPVADAARNWLQKLLLAQDRHVDAAEVATAVPVSRISEDTIEPILQRWRVAFRSAGQDSLADVAQRFDSSFQPLFASDIARQSYRLAAALLLDRDALAAVPAGQGDAGAFADALLEFRQHTTHCDALGQPPQEYLADAIWRLMRDGRAYPQLRTPIADLIEQWDSKAAPSLEHAERLLWKGQTESAVGMIRRLIDDAREPAETTKRAARLLASDGNPRSLREAIKLWDELSSGTKQGSPLWHQAKLAAIGLLRQLNEKEEANRRAKYILLTIPAMDESTRRQYKAVSQ